MENINGLPLKTLDFTPSKQGDLIFHEGPLLSHFTDLANPHSHYFYKWADCDDECNRWLVVKLNEQTISDFFNKKVNLRTIVVKSSFVYLLDLNDELGTTQILLASTDFLPEGYLPSENSFFDEIQYESYALLLKDKFLENKSDLNLAKQSEEINALKEEQKANNQILTSIFNFISSKQVSKMP